MCSNAKLLPHFYTVQPNPQAYKKNYEKSLDHLQGSVRQLYSDAHLVHTKETDGLLRDIGDEVAHLRLDNTLLKSASEEWNHRYAEREIVTQKQALLKATEHLTDPGDQLVARYNTNMDKGRINCNTVDCACTELRKSGLADRDIGVGWTDTNIRSAENWAVKELKGLHDELKPLSNAAQVRTRQYLDQLGITDRYRGYRFNLGYSGKPHRSLSLDASLKTSQRPVMAPRWNMRIEEERAKAVETTDYIAPEDVECERIEKLARLCQLKPYTIDPVSEAGLVRNFPGKSEYQEAYVNPPLNDIPTSYLKPPATHRSMSEQPVGIRGRGFEVELDTERVRSKGYNVNPTPTYLGYWTKNPDKPYEDRISETKDRYKWPKCSEIRTCPWENR